VKLKKFNFDSNVKSGAWFIKFYAPWCTHCQRLAPIWEKLADEQVAQDWAVKIAEVDCTSAKEVCESVQVKAFPLLMLIKNGKMVGKYKGEASAAQFHEWLSKQGVLEAGGGSGGGNAATFSENIALTGLSDGSSKTSIKLFYTTMVSTWLYKMLAEFPTKSQILNLYFYGFVVLLVMVAAITRLFKYVQDEDVDEAETDKRD